VALSIWSKNYCLLPTTPKKKEVRYRVDDDDDDEKALRKRK